MKNKALREQSVFFGKRPHYEPLMIETANMLNKNKTLLRNNITSPNENNIMIHDEYE